MTSSDVVWVNFQGGAILEAPIGGGAPVTLATFVQPDTIPLWSSLAIDAGYLYWAKFNMMTGDGAIMKTPLAGGATVTLAAASYPGDVAVSGGVVYWVDQAGIMSAPTSGGPPAVFGAPGGPLTLAAGKAYWLAGDGNDWAIRTRALAPGAGEVTLTAWNGSETPRDACLAAGRSDTSLYGLAASATDLYWTGDVNGGGCLMRVPLSGGTPTTMSSGAGAGALAVDAGSAYWFDRSFLPSSPPTGSFRILKAPLAGGGPITLAPAVGEVTSLVVDDTSVYFTDFSAGTVVKVTPK